MKGKQAVWIAAKAVFFVMFFSSILFCSLFSPYDASYPEMRQIDYDKLDVLKVTWLLIAGIDGTAWAISKPKKPWRHYPYGAIMLLAVIKLVYFFLIVG